VEMEVSLDRGKPGRLEKMSDMTTNFSLMRYLTFVAAPTREGKL